jgi:putative peptidoglycan lipid II flippase
MSEKKEVAKAAMTVSAFTILSRLLGLVRDGVIAGFFGAGFCSDAFFTAFRIPNLFRRLFAEGALSMAFIPAFTGYLVKQGREEAFQLARSAMGSLLLLMVPVTLIGMLFAKEIAGVLGYGFELPAEIGLTGHLTRIMFPYILFIALAALSMGILNAMGHFTAPALSPAILNLVMIGSLAGVSFFSISDEARIQGLAVGVLTGGAMQFCIQLPFLMKEGLHLFQKVRFFHPELKKIGRRMMPAVFGASAYQINVFMGVVFASTLDEGSITCLYYADRLVELPLGIFAISVATAILPSLSRQAASNDQEGVVETLSLAIRQIVFITSPSALGLILLRKPIVASLFERGSFNEAATEMTAEALLYFASGLLAFSMVRILIAAFNAFSDTTTPLKTACCAVALNFVLSLILMKPMGHGGLALSTTLAALFEMLLLFFLLRERVHGAFWEKVASSVLKSMAATVLMGGSVFLMRIALLSEKSVSMTGYFLYLMICVFAGVTIFILTAAALKSEELKQLWLMIKGV